MSRHARQAAWIVCACAVPRLIVLALAGEPFESDYIRVGRTLVAEWRFIDGGVPTTFLEPVYPAFLAAGLALTGSTRGALVLQILLTCGGALAVFAITRRMTGRARSAWIAAAAYSLFPYYVRQAATFSGAAFWSALPPIALLAIAATDRAAHALGAGVISGLLVLSRFSFAPIAAAGLLLLWRRRATYAIAFACGLLIVLPWMARTYRIDGGFTPPRSGLNLYLSTCEYADWAGQYDFDALFPHLFAELASELRDVPPAGSARAADAHLARRARACAAADPLRTLHRKLRNAGMAFSPFLMPHRPRGDTGHAVAVNGRYELRDMEQRPARHRVPHAIATALLLIGLVVGLWFRRDGLTNDGILLFTIAAFVATTAIFLPTTRLLSPMYAIWMIYAAHGIDRVLSRRETSRTRH